MARAILLKNLGTEDAPVNYREVIKNIACTPLDRNRGSTREENFKAFRILDALRVAENLDKLILEDADYTFLKQKVDKFPFAYSHEVLKEFYEDIDNAEEWQPERAEK